MKPMKGGEASFDWAVLVPRTLHPAQVAIVEALLWVGHPLSATELRDLFAEPQGHYLALIAYHVAKLEELGALQKTGSRQVRGARETFYALAPSPNGTAVP